MNDNRNDDVKYIYVAFITRNGKRIYARQYGYKAFRIPVRIDVIHLYNQQGCWRFHPFLS